MKFSQFLNYWQKERSLQIKQWFKWVGLPRDVENIIESYVEVNSIEFLASHFEGLNLVIPGSVTLHLNTLKSKECGRGQVRTLVNENNLVMSAYYVVVEHSGTDRFLSGHLRAVNEYSLCACSKMVTTRCPLCTESLCKKCRRLHKTMRCTFRNDETRCTSILMQTYEAQKFFRFPQTIARSPETSPAFHLPILIRLDETLSRMKVYGSANLIGNVGWREISSISTDQVTIKTRISMPKLMWRQIHHFPM
jgi:hypothetical protein